MAEEKNIKTNGEDEKTKKINELGRKLKELREAQGITLEHASDATKIQKKYISAIEEGRLDELPKGPYCRSFLRQYCAFLTAPDMWAKYDPLTRGGNVTLEDFKASNEEPDMAVTPGVFRRSPRFWIYLLVVVSLAAAFWVTLRYRGEISTSATTPLEGGTAPIFGSELTAGMYFVDPVPQALTLTSIVIGACVDAMALSLVIKLYQQYHTTNADEIRRLRG